MPTAVGPNTEGEENLVFGYDLGDVSNSYKGEPTTNITPSPQNNSRFTTSNNWYSYNTAQYNGNTYFSIGTVGSVTNNEVTLSSVSRTLYTYDVLRPQTTGGGVTAGTDYFVKKTGTNSFTLHAYNGSQNGSQGYRDPSTGAFKVHESIALDQRISINSTNFPTMWWGGPHLPNMCYVKEVVSSGGPNDNSSFMRIHLTRPAGTDGGMAYGVSPAVTQGDIITVSFWTRSNIERGINYSTHFGGNAAGSFSFTPTSEWQRVEHTWTASVNYSFLQYFWPGNPGTVPYYVDLADIQVEVNKGHATPFTLTSRSATQGLLDLTGNSTIDLTNVSFDSNAQMTFDGTNDYATFSHASGQEPLNNVTFEAVVRLTSNGSYKGMFMKSNYGNSNGHIAVHTTGNGYMRLECSDTLGSTRKLDTSLTGTNTRFTPNETVHFILTYDGSSIRTYINSALKDTYAWNYGLGNNQGALELGRFWAGSWAGDIFLFKQYSKTLTASEIKSNFNAIKGRFNI